MIFRSGWITEIIKRGCATCKFNPMNVPGSKCPSYYTSDCSDNGYKYFQPINKGMSLTEAIKEARISSHYNWHLTYFDNFYADLLFHRWKDKKTGEDKGAIKLNIELATALNWQPFSIIKLIEEE